MKYLLKLAAPYLAVGIFWCFFHNAWLTILAYHIQILLWSRKEIPGVFRGWSLNRFILMGLPCVLGGPLVYFLMPYISAAPVADWLAEFHLTGIGLLVMVPYFGLVHPMLEQAHWGELRDHGWHVHEAFAGYHAIVLYKLLTPPGLALCLIILTAASFTWKKLQDHGGGLLIPFLGHIFADLGIVVAACLLR